jgi:hypothetical protein
LGEFGNEFNGGSSQGQHPGHHHEEDFNHDDEFFDEEDAPASDNESCYIYSAKMIYPPMEIDSDSDDYIDEEDDDFVYCKLILR